MTFAWDQGGNILYGPDQLGAVKSAISEFSKVTDTRASLGAGFVYLSGEVIPLIAHSIETDCLMCLTGFLKCRFFL